MASTERDSFTASLPLLPANHSSELEQAVLSAPEEPVELETYVDLSEQQLLDVPCLLGEITHLRLDSNQIQTVEGLTLPDFTTLTVLDLSFNRIDTFSPVFSKLVFLRELYLNHNLLTEIPDGIGCLSQLEILDIGCNKLHFVSNNIGKLTSLHHLDLRYNQLASLPYALGVLESRLFTLLIDHNPYSPEFKELVAPLLLTEASPLAIETPSSPSFKPANRWRKLRSAMRKSMSMDPSPSGSDGARRMQRVFSMDSTPSTLHHSPPHVRSLSNSRLPTELSEGTSRRLQRASPKSNSPGQTTPTIPAKNPRRFISSVQPTNGVDEGLMERPAFDNRKCQTLDGFVFIADSGPKSPPLTSDLLNQDPSSRTTSNPTSNTNPAPASPSLKKLGYSQLSDTFPDLSNAFQSDLNFDLPIKRQSRSSVNTHSSSSSSSVMSAITAPSIIVDRVLIPGTSDLLRDSGYSTDSVRNPTLQLPETCTLNPQPPLNQPATQEPPAAPTAAPTPVSHPAATTPDMIGEGAAGWPHLPVGGHQLPSHAKLVEFLRRLRDHWDLAPESSEAAQVLQHRRQVKAVYTLGEVDDESNLARPPEDTSEAAQQARDQRRRNIMAEILSTEETYVKSLQALVDIYITGAKERQLFTGEESRLIFMNVQSILLFHRQYLLPEIKREMGTPDPKLGEVFAAHSAYLKMYSLYVGDFDASNSEVERLQGLASGAHGITSGVAAAAGMGSAARFRKRIKQYLEACQLHPNHNQLNLQGYLLLPVQRIPRYRLLLQDLLKFTPHDHPDHPSLVRAYAEIARRADEINERKRTKEANDRVLEIQNRIRGQNQVPLVEPHRRFVKEGPLHLRQIVSLRHTTMPGHSTLPAPPRASSLGPSPLVRSSSGTTVVSSPPPSRLVLRTSDVKLDYHYVLFNDIMIQCKPIHKSNSKANGKDDLELHRVFELGSRLKPARLVNAKTLRVVDNKSIYYFMGPTDELVAWANAINNR